MGILSTRSERAFHDWEWETGCAFVLGERGQLIHSFPWLWLAAAAACIARGADTEVASDDGDTPLLEVWP